MNRDGYVSVNIDLGQIKNHDDYKAAWRKFHPVQMRMIEKNEQCKHELGDTFIINNHYHFPEQICHALMHVLSLYIWRASVGFPSWEWSRIDN